MLCEQERLNNELIVEDWLLAALTVLIRSDLGFGEPSTVNNPCFTDNRFKQPKEMLSCLAIHIH